MKPPSRALTTAAVGFLSLDAVLLGYGGFESGRPLLAAGGGVCAVGAVLVVIGWRRYRRTLAELDAASRELSEDAKAIRELLRSRHLNN
jgi:hypothetical protein